MFEEQPQVGQQTNQPADTIINDSDVHVMPSSYIQAEVPQNQSNKKWLVFGSIGAVVLAIIVGGVIYFLNSQSQPSEIIVNKPTKNSTTTPIVIPSSTPETIATTTSTDLITDAQKDEQRIRDISSLQSALQLYFTDNSVYPDSLTSLVPKYLDKILQDPSLSEGKIYDYRTAADKLDYQIIFNIQDSAKYNNVKLKSGQYTANSRGVFVYDATSVISGTNQARPNLNSTPPQSSQDSDNDGLTDIEENIYQTSPDKVDSDSDGYKDADELLGFYDPSKPKQKLLASGLVVVYTNSKYNYTAMYPKTWVVRSMSDDNKDVIFNSQTGEFFTVSVLDNPERKNSSQWFLEKNPTADNLQLKSVLIASLPAIQTPDGLNTYLAVGDKVFAINYSVGMNNQANFQTTYKLFLKSFTFLEPVTNPTPTPAQ